MICFILQIHGFLYHLPRGQSIVAQLLLKCHSNINKTYYGNNRCINRLSFMCSVSARWTSQDSYLSLDAVHNNVHRSQSINSLTWWHRINLTRSPIISTTMSRSNLPMPASTADLATTWAFLEEGVNHIMTQLQLGVSFSKVWRPLCPWMRNLCACV